MYDTMIYRTSLRQDCVLPNKSHSVIAEEHRTSLRVLRWGFTGRRNYIIRNDGFVALQSRHLQSLPSKPIPEHKPGV